MKFKFVASALSLLPVSLAFAPASLRTKVQSSSSLQMSFLSNLFTDRTGTEKKEKQSLAEAFDKVFHRNVHDLSMLEAVSHLDDKANYEDKVAGNFKYLPSKDMTGVDEHITRLCATMASQAYKLHDGRLENFMLNTDDHKVEVIIQEKQSKFRATNPTFGAAVSGDTLILVWRGTHPGESPMDLVNDAALSPNSSIVWRKHAKSIKIQGAMTSLCINDIVNFEETIIGACKKHRIKEIVTTGHSLGGGIGQVAHTVLRAQMQDANSPWSKLNNVNVRSVVFSAPMTTVVLDDYSDETEEFVDELDENSCNLIFSNDLVPRVYGYLSFINDYADDVIPKLGPYLRKDKPLKLPSLFLKVVIDKIAEAQKKKLLENKLFEELTDVMSDYIHPGNIVYYKDENAKPRVLKDLGAHHANSDNKETYRSVKYIPVKNPIDDFMPWHMTIINGPGLSYDATTLH